MIKPRLHLFGYLDETGLLHTPETDRFFGIGLIALPSPRHLHRSIIRLRNKRRFYREFKFSAINHSTLPIYKELIDLTFAEKNLRFVVQIVDKKGKNHPNKYKSYNKYAGQVIAKIVDATKQQASEYITVLADDVSTNDKDDKFEREVRDMVKKAHRRNALYGIARLESHAVSEIQLADILIGAVAYAFKMKYGLASTKGAKAQLVKYVQAKINVYNLSQDMELRLKNGVYFAVKRK
ncbi:MAG: DUF3800 domain-containing protein [Candidatus Saccharimonadales bacterium]